MAVKAQFPDEQTESGEFVRQDDAFRELSAGVEDDAHRSLLAAGKSTARTALKRREPRRTHPRAQPLECRRRIPSEVSLPHAGRDPLDTPG